MSVIALQRRPFLVVMATLAVVCLATPAMASSTAIPRIHSFAVLPGRAAGSGARALVVAHVAGATKCELSSAPAIVGLPVVVACGSGTISHVVHVPANHGPLRSFLFTLRAWNAGRSTLALHRLIQDPPLATWHWSSPQSVVHNGTSAVSCATTQFCVLVDASGYASIYNGSTWTSPQLIDSSYQLTSVSCPTASFCMAVDNLGGALSYNGSTWSSRNVIALYGTYPNEFGIYLNSVSCPSATFCVAVGAQGTALTYTGGTWNPWVQVASDLVGIMSVSCTSANFCDALDASGNNLSYVNGSWNTSTEFLFDVYYDNPFASVSCVTTQFCVAVGGLNAPSNAATMIGTKWFVNPGVDRQAPSSSDTLAAVSCPSTTVCVAFDSFGYAIYGNRTTWSNPVAVDTSQAAGGVDSVSCPTTSFCVAADLNGDIVIGS